MPIWQVVAAGMPQEVPSADLISRVLGVRCAAGTIFNTRWIEAEGARIIPHLDAGNNVAGKLFLSGLLKG